MENVIQFVAEPQHRRFLEDLAAREDISPGQILRRRIDAEMRRRSQAKTPNRADEHLVARLQRLLVPTMAAAQSWPDLQSRLKSKGFDLRPAGGGLTLHALTDGQRLCKSSELGFAYARLVRRFQQPMPGHPHRMAHVLTTPVGATAAPAPPTLS